MSNGLTPGSSGAPPYASVPRISAIPRRSSYASVVAGADSSHQFNTSWSRTLSGAANATPNNSYPPQQYPDSQLHRHSSGLGTEMQMNGVGNGWRRATPLPTYSRQFANSPEFSGGKKFGGDPFFTPSYLKGSKYISELSESHKAKAAAQKESSSKTPSISRSSSSVNLHRMAPSHRGMTYDIVESKPPGDDNEVKPLPSAWNEGDKYTGLDITGDGVELRYMGPTTKNDQEAATARANNPMPPRCGLYYFEVTIVAKPKDGMVAIGFSSKKASLERLPGWEAESWAYHGDDGKTFFGDNHDQGKAYGPTFTVNDTIGCGVNFATGCAFFTKNGVFLGNAFRELKNCKLYPSVGMKKYPGAHIRANFGQAPFVFDIDEMMAQEKLNVQKAIKETQLSNIHPSYDENTFIQKLVSQFLTHDGYVETAQVFAQEVKKEAAALKNGRAPPLQDHNVEQDIDAINRQKIRKAILDGDIDRALKLTNTYYSNVLQENPQIYFRLRCRKFIEMMRQYTESQATQSDSVSKSENGTAPHSDGGGDVFTHDMELDNDQMRDADNEDRMDTEDGDDASKHQDLIHEAIRYGQQLQADYPGDEKKEYKKTLDDIFSLIAYPDPKSSVHGHLLDPSGRVTVAEELNSAILVSLGKSSSAALERLFQQTEVLINEISEDGGAGALVNVRADYLV
ncbi:hypothetical protein VTO42DRAFT_3664 [Malbranchea cinnamomea]